MGATTSKNIHLTSWDLEMIEISWAFVRYKQELGLNTMIRQNIIIIIKLYIYICIFKIEYLKHHLKLRKCFYLQVV